MKINCLPILLFPKSAGLPPISLVLSGNLFTTTISIFVNCCLKEVLSRRKLQIIVPQENLRKWALNVLLGFLHFHRRQAAQYLVLPFKVPLFTKFISTGIGMDSEQVFKFRKRRRKTRNMYCWNYSGSSASKTLVMGNF